ncbi:translocation/assembly module TamB domain-containing protein [Halomonas sp. PAMB 3264]|uniref:autotransporter assembly complex protein TamB n=1 Tax=Halomonas sp. PAMB 3264 TaxID=3075222 RepID=UPI0028A101E2|nr:translocation/assembly module TamB domain-containing protein [Halomonas sp. PAMB 3264]WNL43839.1 translocation/assembly module TamB domain-containing protein [Halomonas sp. PAMB 3264]
MADVAKKKPRTKKRLSSGARTRLAVWSVIRLVILVPLWLFGLVALVLGAALSPWGTAQLFSQVEKRGYVSVEAQSGGLLDEFTLQGFRMNVAGVQVAIDDLELRWADDCLLSGRLCIDTLRAEGADIRLGASQNEPEPPPDNQPPLRITLPFPIELRELVLNDTAVTLGDGTRITVDSLTSAAIAEGQSVRLAPTELDQPRVYLPPSPGVRLTQGLETPLDATGIDGAIAVHTPPAPEPAEQEDSGVLVTEQGRTQLPDIMLPIDVIVEELAINDFALEGAVDYSVERLTLVGSAVEHDIAIDTFYVLTPDAEVNLDGTIRLAEEYPLDLNLATTLYLPERFPELSGNTVSLALSGSLAELEGELDTEGLVNVVLDASVDVLDPLFAFDVRLQTDELQWPLTPVEGSDAEPIRVEDLDLRASGNLEAFAVTVDAEGIDDTRLDGQVDLDDPSYPFDVRLQSERFQWPLNVPEDADTAAEPFVVQNLDLHASGSLEEFTVTLDADGVENTRLEARADIEDPNYPFTARLQSDRLQWPLITSESADVTPWVVQNLDLRASGDINAYTLALDVEAEGPDVPLLSLNLEGSGDTGSFGWSTLALQIDESRLASQGRVNWANAITLDTTIRLDEFDPSHFVAELDGSLNGDIELGVLQQGERWLIDLPTLDIEGELRDYPLTLAASLRANSDLEADIESLVFTQGNNRLTAQGRASQQALSIDADIALNQLQTIHPQLAGRLAGNVQARGSIEQPQINAALEGSDLRFADNAVERLSLNADISGIDDPRLDIDLLLDRVVAGGQTLQRLELTLEGLLSQHTLSLDVQGDDTSALQRAELALRGRFDQANQLYQANVTPLEIDSDAGDIRLESPLDLRYNLANGQARLSPFCLRRLEGGLVCSTETVNASAEQGRALLTVREVPMEALEPFLPEEWRLDGDTTADLALSWSQGGARWQADVELLSELAITAVDGYGQPVRLPVINLDARIDANQANANASVVLSLSEAGRLALDLSVSDPIGRGGLNGELRASNIVLEPYLPLVAQLDELQGALNGTVSIGGTTAQPDLQGTLALRGVRARGPDIPIDVQDGELALRFDGGQGSIDGFIAAERGRLNISGDAYWPENEQWRAGVDLNAVQEPLLVVLPQFGRLEAAPNIRIRVNPERLQIRGNVDIPWARLEIGSLPASAITPSGDEIIITERDDREAERIARLRTANGEGPSAADELAAGGMEIDMLITLNLGDDMELSAYGLESNLAGSLEVRQDSGVLQLFGEVNLVDGRFQAFGQDLLIRRGQLLFSGPPGLPVLNFEAIRNPEVTQDDVIAGLRVTGTAEEPNVAIFSEPAMPENSALSYVLRGRAPDSSGGVDSALTTALIGMSLGRTGGAVGSIGEAFGINDLTLDTTGAGDESQVALSGQLTDDLRISYGVGIFSPIAELTLRYTLWRNFYVQVVTGTSQAVDLIYTFSRPGSPTILPPILPRQ